MFRDSFNLRLAKPSHLPVTVDDQALNFFMANFNIAPRAANGQRGHFQYMGPLLAKMPARSHLEVAALAVGSAALANRRDKSLIPLARLKYGEALALTHAAITNPATAMNDETLMAICLLSVYEVRCTLVWFGYG